ncbi:xylulokinase [Acidisoma silvae]|uniref:Xylulose kinase n=1 Tax=Acidisoma silvae TaxID=2802396 RepID=A0A963YXU8_9PROT|nr:xylulokinase [Acidisoma silvae]MCB8878183.1 xylulokinase [Acidisoma silvae]
MERHLVAGIDTSTQSCTVVLRRLEDGAFVAQGRAPHPATTPPRSEQDPRDWWQALTEALGQIASHLPSVAAISVGGQGHGLVILDGDDEPIRPAKLWNDTESAADAALLCEQLSAAEWATRTGSVPAPALTISKIAWTRAHVPDALRRAEHIMLPADYLGYRLSRHAVTERGGSSGTGYFNPFLNTWDHELAELAAPGLAWDRVLPKIITSDAVAGTVGRLRNLESLSGAVVGAGSGDNMTAALGLGIREGDTVISLGTSGTIYAVTDIGVKDATGAINGYADATGRFLPMITTLNAAKVTDFFRRMMGVDTGRFDALALAAEPGSAGVVVVPYLDGERTPNLPGATGQVQGLRSNTSPGQIARAAVEGVLCSLLDGQDLLRAAGTRMTGRLILTGGAARSRAYQQVLADLTGQPVYLSRLDEAAAAGAAVQATAALTGRSTEAVATDWAPELSLVATPQSGIDAVAVRSAYQQAAARVRKQAA